MLVSSFNVNKHFHFFVERFSSSSRGLKPILHLFAVPPMTEKSHAHPCRAMKRRTTEFSTPSLSHNFEYCIFT